MARGPVTANLAPCLVTKVGTYGETPFELFKSAGWRAAPSPADNCINPRIAGCTRGIREAGRADHQPARMRTLIGSVRWVRFSVMQVRRNRIRAHATAQQQPTRR